jgi:hypothetical protein
VLKPVHVPAIARSGVCDEAISRSRSRGFSILAATLALAILFHTFSAHAGVTTAESEGVRATLYAPDWVWKGQNLNFLMVFENPVDRSDRYTIKLELPDEYIGDFPQAGLAADAFVMAPETTTRFAFANISSEDATVGRTYPFTVIADGPDWIDSPIRMRFEISTKLRVIRGSVVAEGIWAAILPAAVAAAWCIVLAMYFRRHAAPGAWRTPSPAVWESRAA